MANHPNCNATKSHINPIPHTYKFYGTFTHRNHRQPTTMYRENKLFLSYYCPTVHVRRHHHCCCSCLLLFLLFFYILQTIYTLTISAGALFFSLLLLIILLLPLLNSLLFMGILHQTHYNGYTSNDNSIDSRGNNEQIF